jgi:hypothetical protein
LRAGTLEASGREVELAVFSEGSDEHVIRAKPSELASGLGVDLAHEKRDVTSPQKVKLDTLALGQQLADLGVIALAAGLLVGTTGVAIVELCLPVALAKAAGQGLLVCELTSVVGKHEKEDCVLSIGFKQKSHRVLSTSRTGPGLRY